MVKLPLWAIRVLLEAFYDDPSCDECKEAAAVIELNIANQFAEELDDLLGDM